MLAPFIPSINRASMLHASMTQLKLETNNLADSASENGLDITIIWIAYAGVLFSLLVAL